MRTPAVVLALALSLSPSLAFAQLFHRRGGPREAPPPPRVEQIHPRHGFVWDPGHWVWRGHHYSWVRGHYVRERRGGEWRGGAWDRHDDHYDWHPGGWR
jgi:hypothetical protein